MRDDPVRVVVKTGVRWVVLADLWLVRRFRQLRGQKRWNLGGSCGGCARCCDHPTIAVGRLVWYFPTLRWLFLQWQRVINGFVLEQAVRAGRFFVFRCTHFDVQTRRCDSYHSRPAMCRDYPRLLLDRPWPELFPECGYRPISTDPDQMVRLIDQEIDDPEHRQALKDRLKLL